MRKAALAAMGVMLAAWLTGCTSAAVTSGGGSSMDSARADAYDGPKARVVVSDFEDKMSSSGYYRADYGRGMKDMLATALFQSNRYILLERERMAAIEAERARRRPATKLEDADIVITAAITGFGSRRPPARSGRAGRSRPRIGSRHGRRCPRCCCRASSIRSRHRRAAMKSRAG